MEEVWKDVVGYEGLYQVSNKGRVRSLPHRVKCSTGIRLSPGKLLKNCFDKNYYHVTLFKNGVRSLMLVHRLVAQSFIGNEDMGKIVNHIDGNKLNNISTNLEWVTHSENIKHAFRLGLQKPHDGGKSKPIIAYDMNGNYVGEYKSLHDAERKLFVNIGNIWSALNGRKGNAKGYIFKYKH